jgi:hypothetical protein
MGRWRAVAGGVMIGWLIHDAAGFFTLLLVIVGAVQVGLFVWQLKLIRTSLEDAKLAADAATDAATAASRQAHVAEETLAKIERPYLFVYNVSTIKVVDESHLYEDGTSFIGVTYSVANHGKIPAIIKFALASLSVSAEPLPPARLDYDHTLVVSPILAPGEIRIGIEERLKWEDFKATEYDPIAPDFGQNELWFWVIITYRGPFSDQHETRICWRFDEATYRFIGPFGGSEHSGEK